MWKIFLSSLVVITSFSSCKKKEDPSPIIPEKKSIINLFPDGGFELANTLNAYWGNRAGMDSIARDLVTKKTGQASMYILANNSSDLYHQPISIQMNYYYKFSLWYKFLGPTSSIDNFIVGFRQAGKLPYYVDPVGIWPATVNINWTQFTDTIYFTSQSDVEFYLHSNVRETWIDDLVLEPLGPVPPTPPTMLTAIQDGGFELPTTLDSFWSDRNGMDTLYLDKVIKKSGNSSLYIQTGPNDNSDLSHEPIAIEINKNYVVSICYKLKGPTKFLDNFGIVLTQDGKSVFYKDPVGNWTDTVDINWSRFTDTIQFSNGSDVKFNIFTNVEQAWIDDVVLEKL